ncbi:hypothetical protein OH747_39635 (plasmid) [Streptomyces anthocyanicus]|nr:hypothetical protein OH747_39635 [Streptomyces anthocyanicus]
MTDNQHTTRASGEAIPRVAELDFPACSVIRIWLHRPTGMAGASALWRLPDGGPTAGHGIQFLPATNPAPHRTEPLVSTHHSRRGQRTDATRLGDRFPGHGSEEAGRLSSPNRQTGRPRVLQASEPDDVIWQLSDFEAVAFVVQARSLHLQKARTAPQES